jgi:hypothetical protein
MSYYKVVRIEGKKLVSVCAPKEFAIEYIPNQWIKTQYSHICCFDDLEKALEFINFSIELGYAVWKCEVGKIFRNCNIPNCDYKNRFYLIEKLRRQHKSTKHLSYTTDAFPGGTIFTDKIMLKKKMI